MNEIATHGRLEDAVGDCETETEMPSNSSHCRQDYHQCPTCCFYVHKKRPNCLKVLDYNEPMSKIHPLFWTPMETLVSLFGTHFQEEGTTAAKL